MAAPIPKKLAIMRWLTTHLEGTTGKWEDDSDIDLDGVVYRGRKFFSEEDFAQEGDVALSILEAPRPLITDSAGVERVTTKEDWTLLLQGWAKDDKKHPSDPAYFLQAAVDKRLSEIVKLTSYGEPEDPDKFRMGELIVEMIIGQGLVRPPDGNITKYTMFYTPLIIRLVTDVSNPYLP